MDDHATTLVNKVMVSRGDINMQRQCTSVSGRWVVKALMPLGRFIVV